MTKDQMIAKLAEEGDRLREVNRELVAALEAAVSCGMVPISSSSDGGATRHSEQVRVADMIRAVIAKAKETAP